MSEDSSETNNNNDSPSTSTTSHSRRSKKEEIFGFPKDDVTLTAAVAGLGLAGLVGGVTIWNMIQEGKIPNPFAPNNPRISYSDVYEQQRAQQEWEAQQRAQSQHQQQQHQLPAQQQQQAVEGNIDPSAGTMPAFTGAEEFDIEGEQFSTAPPKKTDRFNRINGG